MGDIHTMVDGDLYLRSVNTARDLQAEVDRLTRELTDATARADSLDVRCSAAERLARAVTNMHGFEPDDLGEAAELAAAMELWQRVNASHHTTRANDYSEAIQQLAEARRWLPELDDENRGRLERNAAHRGQTIAEYGGQAIDTYLDVWGELS